MKKEVSPEVLHKRELNKLKIHELVHWWCNSKIKIEYDRREYSFTPDKFYLNNKQYAQIYKNHLLCLDYNNIGAFGNGTASYTLLRAFPNNNTIIFNKAPFHLLDKNYQKENPDIIIDYIINEILVRNENSLNRISYYKEVIENNRILGLAYLKKENFINIDFIKNYKVIFNKKLITKALAKKVNYTTEYKKYKGWSSRNYELLQKLNHNHSINEIIDKGLSLYFNEEEIEILKLKEFLYNYCRIYDTYYSTRKRRSITSTSYTISLKEAKAIWFSDKKEEWKRNAIAASERRKNEKQLKKLQEEKAAIKLGLFSINAFRAGKATNYRLSILNYTVLALIRDEESKPIYNDGIVAQIEFTLKPSYFIKSSLGMRIEIEEAKKALKLFRLKETKHDLIQGFKYQGIIKRQIPYINDEGDIDFREEDCIKVGCHIVPESEIKAFLEYYKLNW